MSNSMKEDKASGFRRCKKKEELGGFEGTNFLCKSMETCGPAALLCHSSSLGRPTHSSPPPHPPCHPITSASHETDVGSRTSRSQSLFLAAALLLSPTFNQPGSSPHDRRRQQSLRRSPIVPTRVRTLRIPFLSARPDLVAHLLCSNSSCPHAPQRA